MKNKSIFVGTGEDVNSSEVKNVILGEFVFKLMDQEGLPFDIILLELKEKNLTFDIQDFILSAIKSKNFSKKKLKLLFEMNDNPKYPDFLQTVFKLINVLWKQVYEN